MASITKSVRIDGSGDYTDLVTGINNIISSGVADGTLTEMILIVDSGYYSGNFNISIPNSGSLFIYGSGTWFAPTDVCYVSGIYSGQNNFTINKTCLIGSNASRNILSIAGGTYCELSKIHYFGGSSGIISSGNLSIIESDATGNHNGYFIVSPTGYLTLTRSTIAGFNVAISGYDSSCYSSRLIDNTNCIISTNYININDTLLTGVSGVIASGIMLSNHITFDTTSSNILGSSLQLTVTNSILSSNAIYSINGVSTSGVVSGCCFDMVGWNPILNISGVNISGAPLFNNSGIYDYRLQMRDNIGSSCIEVVDPGILSGVTLYTDQSQLSLKDSIGIIEPTIYNQFIYKQGNTLLFSDYEKENLFADINFDTDLTRYSLWAQAKFSASGIILSPAMDSENALFPYDWDFKVFESAEIVINSVQIPGRNLNDYEYIIPRSILDVSTTISPFLGTWSIYTSFSKVKKDNITAYLYNDARGVAFDYDISKPNQPIMWAIEGRNQILSKIDGWTGEVLDQYPLLINNNASAYIYPSGLIAAGVFQNKYKYLLASDPNKVIYSSAGDGGFQWLSTRLDLRKDAQGIMAYKGNLYISVSEYGADIFDRGYIPVNPENNVVGSALVMYYDNHTFNHYVANYGFSPPMVNAPLRLPLVSGNAHPTDLTIYEDGTVYVADYLNSSGLYRYKFVYDYALIQSSYDQESLVLLRENYDNVEI